MAINVTIQSTDGGTFDLTSYLANSEVSAFTATTLSVAYPDIATATFHLVLAGSGLSYNSDNSLASGIFTGISITLPDDTTAVANVTGLNIDAPSLSAAIQTANASAIDALLFQAGSVNFLGNIGGDQFTAGGGADTLDGGAGADTLDGSDGIDTVTFVHSASPVTVDLFLGVGTGGDAQGDVYLNIENAVGSAGDDQLTGDTHDNVLIGGAGADALDGGDGSDTASYAGSDAAVTASLVAGVAGVGGHAQGDLLTNIENLIGSDFADVLTGDTNDNVIEGGKGADTLVGGGGSDTVSYVSSIAGVTVTLGAAGAQTVASGPASDALGDKISGFVNVIGGFGNDVLTGNELANTFDGRDGLDVIKGNAGDDVLLGGAGNDSLDGGIGNDTLVGGAGADIIIGGDGTADTASYADSTSAVTIALGLNGALGVAAGGSADGDKITFVENLVGSGSNDILTGNNLANLIVGGLGDDTLSGGDNKDGKDTNDTVSYAHAGSAVFVDLTLQGSQQDTVSAGLDTLSGFENIIGSGQADTLTGDGNNNVIEGGAGADTLDGGSGSDTASYAGSAAGVSIDLNVVGAQGGGGDGNGDTLAGFENIIGSAFDDVLTGNAGDDSVNTIDARGGNDIVAGLGANDVFNGGDGVDTIDLSANANNTTLTLAAANVVSKLNNGALGSILNFENIIGGDGNDVLTGNAADNVIDGGFGSNILDGGLGNDTLSYAQRVTDLTLVMSAADAQGFVTIGNDKVRNFESLVGGAGNDTITGNGLANVIDGGAGDDVLDGAGGLDTVSFATAQSAVALTFGVLTGSNVAQSNAVLGGETDSVQNFENVTGSAFDDQLAGNDGVNTIRGGTGNDVLSGAGGNDTIAGDSGDDTLAGGAGGDVLDGGAGNDIADYSTMGAAQALTVTLGAPGTTVTLAAVAGFESSGDKLISIEGVVGGAGNDVLTGNALANALSGGGGDDTIQGGAGADALDGGANGTKGDTLSYASSAVGVTIDIGANTASGGDATGDTITGFENVIGSAKDDIIGGSDGDNVLAGGLGTNTVTYASASGAVTVDLSNILQQDTVGAGKDTLTGFQNIIGSAGNDTLTGNASVNVIGGGAGADTLTGTGNDILSYAGDTAGVSVNLKTKATSGGNAAGDTISGFISFVGGSGDDSVIGTDVGGSQSGGAGDDNLNGGTAADTLLGGAGDDNLFGGKGADVLDGGSGSDWVLYQGDEGTGGTQGVTITLGLNGALGTASGAATGDKITNVENIFGSDAKDVLTGNNLNNELDGNGGDDTLDGKAGDDILVGGAGNDTYFVDSAGDQVIEATGEGANDVVNASVSFALTDGQEIEKLVLTGTANINGTGNDSDNIIIGNAGANVIEGGAGNDTLDGGANPATAGDTLSYASDTVGVTVTLMAGLNADLSGNVGNDAAGDTAKNFENILGGAGADKLTGDTGANVIEGGAGADILDGGSNPSTAGDTVSYAGSIFGVTVDLSLQDGVTAQPTQATTNDASGDILVGFENILGSDAADVLVGDANANKIDGGLGNDDLTGGGNNDTITGGAGDDIVEGGAGADVLDGGAGFDTLWYGNSMAAVTVSLNTTTATGIGGEAAGDKITNIEDIVGSNFSDSLQGGAASNFLYGLDGNDKLDGGAGADLMVGGLGDDTYVVDNAGDVVLEAAGEGNDTIQASISYTLDPNAEIENITLTGTAVINATGNSIANRIVGNASANILVGGGGGDFLDGGAGVDTASYADNSDDVSVSLISGTGSGGTADGDTLVNIENLTGGSGDDTLVGDKNVNVIDGGFGDDFLIGGAGADKLIGGAGVDTVSYAGSTAGVTVKLALATSQAGGDAAGDILSGIENVFGSTLNDVLVGNGHGTLQGDAGDDTLSNADQLVGGTGSDTYVIDGGTPVIVELDNEGTDTVLASVTIGSLATNVENLILAGKANIDGVGNAAANVVTGNDGKNNLDGGDGDDTLTGGKGNDTLTGGAGNDTFVYRTGDGADTIIDFAAGGLEDRINLLGTTITSFSQLLTSAQDVGTDVVINFGTGNTLTLLGVQEAQLTNADFLINSSGNQAPNDITLSSNTAKSDAGSGTVIGTLTALDPDTGDALKFSLPTDAGGLFSVSGNTLKTSGALSAGTYDIVVRVADAGGLSYSEGFTITVTQAQAAPPAAGSGNDDIKGTSGVDTLYGLAGNDVLRGLGSGDILDGGLGIDTVSYFDAIAAVTANLADPSKNTGDAKGDTYVSVEALRGTRFNDTLVGNDDFNTLNGGPGSDVLDGGANQDVATYQNSSTLVTVSLANPGLNTGEAAGDVFISIERLRGSTFDDFLQGDSNDNALEGFTGADKLDGGGGFDYARYNIAAAGVTVSLDNPAINTGDAKGDTFISIEGLWGSDFNDKLIGNAVDSTMVLESFPGFAGFKISNVLVGGVGADVLDGGGGFDIAAYFTSPAFGPGGVVANLGNPTFNTGDAAGDSYISIEGLWGSTFADVLTGDANDNLLRGDAGDDVLAGGISGGADGNDFFDGGDGVDMVSYAAATAGFTASLHDPSKNTGAAAGDSYFVTSNNGDGVGKSNTTNIEALRGGSGDDVLYGNFTGPSALIGGAGKDQLHGSIVSASDSADYRYSTVGLTVSLADPTKNTGEAAGDTYDSIERLRGSNFDDFLQGDANDNMLEGGGGNDVLDGGAGTDYVRYFGSQSAVTVNLLDVTQNTGDAKGDAYISIEGLWGSQFDDVLIGFAGDDLLMGGAGADKLVGGTGSNTAVYLNTPTMAAGLTADLADPTKNTADGAGDVYVNIQNLIGSFFADSLFGDSGNNSLQGNDGDDTLTGRAGADILNGGNGNDTASYRDASVGVAVDISVGTNSATSNINNTGDAKGDTFISIENVAGTAFDDYIIGNGANNILAGGAGADKLDGAGGFDTASYLNASAGVTADLSNSANNTGDAAGDTYFSIEALRGSKFADHLKGNGGANTLDGQDGDDWLDATPGNDVYLGGTGWDTLTFWNSAGGGVTVNLGQTAAQTVGDINGDTVSDTVTLSGSDIEAVVGSVFADHLTASNGTNKGNYLDGWDGDDTLTGGFGNDILVGGFGNDVMSAGGGNDTIDSAFNSQSNGPSPQVDDGTDTIDGGLGIDTVTYVNAVDDVTVDLSLVGTNQDTGGGGIDNLTGIENVTGGSGNDELTGDGGDNVLDGGAGNDALTGGDGNDTLIGGHGNDTFSGGLGFDTISYASATGSVTFNLGSLAAQGTGANNTNGTEGTDKLLALDVEALIGSNFNDSLTGGGGNDTLSGGAGDDTLNGTQGDDTLFGGDGNDFLIGGGFGGTGQGNDALDGGAGFDTVSYHLNTDPTKSVTASLANNAVNDGLALGDTYVSIENLRGGAGNDVLTGDTNNNTLTGGGGNDVLDGGGGFDTASYQDITDGSIGVTVDLRIQGAGRSQNTVGDGTDTLINIRNLAGGAGADVLIGDDNTDFGNRLFGNNGNDILIGGLGPDVLDGGAGSDLASYRFATKGVTANLANPTLNTGDAAGDIYAFDANGINTIEGLEGSNLDDVLIGDEGQNTLRGGAGKDTLIGGGGGDSADYREMTTDITVSLADTTKNTGDAKGDTYISIEGIFGGSGNDTLIGDAFNNILQGNGGKDTLDGGAGVDIASYGFATTALTVNLADPTKNTVGSDADGDKYISIEGLSGGSANDTLIGDDHDNYLRGAGGADKLDGGLGLDYAGYWLFNPGTGPLLTVNLGDPSKNTGEAVGDTFISIEGIVGSDFNDRLIGDANDNVLIGGAGKDILEGGGGTDFASYYQFFARSLQIGVTVNLGDTSQNTGDAVGDTYVGIENLIGSQFNDTLIGDANDNILNGGEGLNSLDGGAGNDTFIGGVGYNSFHGGDGFDTVSYDASPAGLTIGFPDATGTNTINDFIDDTVEYIRATKFNDKIQAGGFGQFVDGGAGDDVISTFGATMIGGAGADKLQGSFVTDTVSYQTSTMDLTIDLNLAVQHGGDAEGDQLTSIEMLIGGSGNDTLIGRTFHAGELGTLWLNGGAGDDHLIGNVAGMTLIGGSGADLLEAAAGNPPSVVSYDTALAGVTVDLNVGTDTSQSLLINTGDAHGDTFINITNIVGTAFNDKLVGIESASTIHGGDGDDYLDGGVLDGGAGADALHGGSGPIDVAVYWEATAGVTADLTNPLNNTGEAAGDTYFNLEGLEGSDFDDRLVGIDGITNRFRGGGGNDVIIGKNGNDIIYGEDGNDTLTGGAGTDMFRYQFPTSGGDTITDFASGIDALVFDASFGVTADASDGPGPSNLSGAKALKADYFVTGTSATATGHFQFIFDTSVPGHNTLYFDADGTGSGSKVMVADVLSATFTIHDIGLFV